MRNKNFVFGWAALMMMAISALFAPVEVQANSQYGEKNLVIFKSTFTATTDTNVHISSANGGAIFGSVSITSPTPSGGMFTVYDSSNSTISGREILGLFSCSAANHFEINVEADLGLTYTSSACVVTMKYLDHR